MQLLDTAGSEPGLTAEASTPAPTPSGLRPRNTAAILIGFSVLYFGGSLAWATRKTLWFDELFTYKIAQLRTLGDIWDAIRAGIECNPPLSFVLAHWSQHAFGVNALATRLPAIIGYWVMSMCLFAFVRRRTDTTHGLIAMFVPFFTLATFYISEARPYGMVLGATGLTLLCWQSAEDSRYRWLAVLGLCLSCAALASLHYYAIYVPLAITVGEAARSSMRRRLDIPVAIALLAGLASVLFWLPLITAARASSSHFWGAVGFDQLGSVFRDFSSPVWFAVLAVGMLLISNSDRTADPIGRLSMPRPEIIVCSLLVAMPVVMFAAALATTNAYATRYVLPAVPGFAILVAFGMYQMGGLVPKLSGITAMIFGICFVGSELLNLASPIAVRDPQTVSRQMYAFPSEPPLPIAVGSDDAFLRVRHYGDASLAARCYYLTDMQAAAQFYGVDTGERSLSEWRRFQPDNIVDYKKFIQQNPDFYAVRVSQHGWLMQKLSADGAQITLLSSKKELNFEAEEQMYFRVHMPQK